MKSSQQQAVSDAPPESHNLCNWYHAQHFVHLVTNAHALLTYMYVYICMCVRLSVCIYVCVYQSERPKVVQARPIDNSTSKQFPTHRAPKLASVKPRQPSGLSKRHRRPDHILSGMSCCFVLPKMSFAGLRQELLAQDPVKM